MRCSVCYGTPYEVAKRIEIASKDDPEKGGKERAKAQIQGNCREFIPGVETDIVERRRHVDNALWTIHFAQQPRLGASEFTKQHARTFVLSPKSDFNFKIDKIYMEEEKTTQIENPGKITLEEFAELIRQMRHNQRRYFAQRRPEILETCKRLEGEVDAVIAKMFDKQLKMF